MIQGGEAVNLTNYGMDMSDAQLAVLLGRSIRAERYRLGLSQEQLAEVSGLHRTYIGVIERGEKNITICNCKKIAHALNLTLWELIRKCEDFRKPASA